MVERVTLYRAPTTAADADAIAAWLRERVEATVTVRERFLDRVADDDLPEDVLPGDDLAEAFARARVLDPHERETGNEMLGIVRYEERAIEHPERAGGVIYDGLDVQHALGARLPPAERDLDHLHVALLDRVLGTWEEYDGRWHKRVSVLGQPALLSVPGLFEAPAKPETYYREQQRHAMLSGDTPPREVLENQVEGEFLVADDPRTTDALKGYVLQAIELVETGSAFCDVEHCRLHDAHCQPGVIDAQLCEPAFCDAHAERYAVSE